MSIRNFKGVLFDLDGTLMDTSGDLGTALNKVLIKRGLSALALDHIRPAAGRGCKGLLKLGLDMETDHVEYNQLANELLNFYEEHVVDTTQLFPGMDDVLTHLDELQIPWGIVTNKPARFTSMLMEKLHLNHRAVCVISGDTYKNRKPHPEPLLQACELLQISPENCLYVGDSEVDIIASKAAGMPAIVAMYGYIPQDEKPELWLADGYIQHPLEIIEWLNSMHRQ